jgi:hypothetical protein
MVHGGMERDSAMAVVMTRRNRYTVQDGKTGAWAWKRGFVDQQRISPVEVKRILGVARAAYANAAMRACARVWYARWDDVAALLSREYGVSHDVARGVLCALSPGCSIEQNISYAVQSLATGKAVGFFGDSRRKAQAIMAGGDIISILDGKTGKLKVFNFYMNTVTHGQDTIYCTIDRWAWRTQSGDYSPENDSFDNNLYDVCVRTWCFAARLFSILTDEVWTPAYVQALCWEYDRVTHGERPSTDVIAYAEACIAAEETKKVAA